MNKMKFGAMEKDSGSHDMINVCVQSKMVMEPNMCPIRCGNGAESNLIRIESTCFLGRPGHAYGLYERDPIYMFRVKNSL